jgi:flagellar assembly factor FliW
MTPKRRDPPPEPSAFTVETAHFGPIRVEEDQVITLSPGLPGFPDLRRYLLIQHSQESPFLWLQCLDDPALAFAVLDPVHIVPDYRPGPPEALLKQLEAKNPADLKVLVIVTIPPGRPQDLTANLMAPVVINLKTRRGKQLVLERSLYSHQHRVMGN